MERFLEKEEHNSGGFRCVPVRLSFAIEHTHEGSEEMWSDEPLWMPREFVQEDGDTVDGSTTLEMGLDVFGGGHVVDVANEDAARVDIFFIVAELVALLLQRGLHLAESGSLFLHLGHSSLHGGDLVLTARQERDVSLCVLRGGDVERVSRRGACIPRRCLPHPPPAP